jgi:hypothetical protein
MGNYLYQNLCQSDSVFFWHIPMVGLCSNFYINTYSSLTLFFFDIYVYFEIIQGSSPWVILTPKVELAVLFLFCIMEVQLQG